MRRLLLALTASLICALSFATPAEAHHATYYGKIWPPGGPRPNPTWHFTPSVPNGEWRDRITGGVNEYNNLGESLRFNKGNDLPDRDPFASCSAYRTVTMHLRPYDGANRFAAYSLYCEGRESQNQNQTFRQTSFITFDNAERWCAGSGDCGSGKYDLWSVASHEFGHVTSLGHYGKDDDACKDNQYQATMCANIVPGTERMRTLHPHDIDSFRARY
ncbi:MAG: matrixin family metalloprotease [Sporichthyaceae bacterium]